MKDFFKKNLSSLFSLHMILFNSNVFATFLIAVGIIIILGVFYETKLWHDIREIKKTLHEMEKNDDKDFV